MSHPETAAPDTFRKGMASWTESDDQVLDRYRLWQAQLISPFLGRRVLEVGAGPGMMASFLAGSRSFDRYLALEPSEHFFPMLRKVAAGLPGLECRNCTTADVLPGLAGDFDTVFSIHVMEHVEDDAAFVSQCRDLLAPGGKAIILVPALGFLYSDLDRKIGHFRRYDRVKIRALARAVDMELVLNRYDNLIGALGYLWVCKIRKVDYHNGGNKKTLLRWFRLFSDYVLPVVSAVEKRIPPPIGLNLTAVLQKPLQAKPAST